MRLRHLRVRNIRSYVHAAIDFADGTTLIAGDVGAGKTSLLYAIEMALFGTSEVDAAYLVRHGAPHAEVDVTFEDAAHRYRIARRFRRVRRKGKETFEPETISFAVDGHATEYSSTELRQRVIELLGFPDNPNPQAHSDLWRWAVYVPQERMRDILAAKPQERLETVRKALGVERYRTAAENAQEVALDLRRSAEEEQAAADALRHHDDEFSEWTHAADRARVDRAALTDALDRRRAAVTDLRRMAGDAEAALHRAAADQRELESLEREESADRSAEAERDRWRAARDADLRRHRATVDGLEAEAGRLEERRVELARIDQEVGAGRAEIDRHATSMQALVVARADLASARQRAAEAQAHLDRAVGDRDAAKKDREEADGRGPSHEPPAPTADSLEQIDARLEECAARERDALAGRARAEAALHEYEELLAGGTCPRCGQAVRPEEFEPHRAEAQAALALARTAYERSAEVRAQTEQERRARERFERARDRWLESARARADARARETRADQTALGAAETLARGADAVRAAEARIEELAPEEGIDAELRARADEVARARDRAATQLEAAQAAQESHRVALASVHQIEGEIERWDREQRTRQERRDARAERIDTLRAGLSESEASRDRARELAGRVTTEEQQLSGEEAALVRLDGRLDEAIRRVADAERGRAERAERTARAAARRAQAEWIGGPFRRAVLAMEQRLLAHAQTAFERSLTRHFATLIDDPALVARTDVAFTPAVAIDGEWTPAEALSGGERTSLALAFRLALAEVVRTLGNLHLDTILLDEPTDGFSPEQVVRMGELLDALALPQVILVSHEDELAGIADRVVRVEKTNGRSVLRSGSGAGGAPEGEE